MKPIQNHPLHLIIPSNGVNNSLNIPPLVRTTLVAFPNLCEIGSRPLQPARTLLGKATLITHTFLLAGVGETSVIRFPIQLNLRLGQPPRCTRICRFIRIPFEFRKGSRVPFNISESLDGRTAKIALLVPIPRP